MTYTSNLTSVTKLHATLRIDGIPILFGTRDGLTMAAVNTTNARWPALTSVDAIVPESLKLETTKLDTATLMVPPAGASLSLAINSTYDKYFERRRTPQTHLTAQCTIAAATLAVGNTAGFVAGQPLYVNRETMLIDAVATSRTITVVAAARNWCSLPGNKISAHNTDATVSSVPRHLLGRMAELRFWSSDDEADSEVVRYLFLSASPQYDLGAGQWRVTFTDAMSMFGRKIAVGFKGATPTTATGVSLGSGTTTQHTTKVTYGTEDAKEFATSTLEGSIIFSPSDPDARVGGNGNDAILPILGRSSTFPVVGLILPAQPLVPYNVDASTDVNINGTYNTRRVYVFDGQPLKAAMQVLLSDAGQAENHATYDVLFGLTSSASSASFRISDGNSEKRFGAAIPAALVTVPADVEMIVPGWSRVLGATGEEDLLDFMMDCAYAAGGFWVFTDTLRFVSFDGVYTTDTLTTVTVDTGIAEDTAAISVDDESTVVHSVTMKCNYNFLEKEFKGIITATYTDEAETYREQSATVTLERKGLVCDVLDGSNGTSGIGRSVSSVAGFEDIRIMLDRMFFRFSKGTRRYKVELPWSMSRRRPADLVRLTYEFFNAFNASTVSSQACMVMSSTPDLERGSVVVELEAVHTGKVFSPTAEIATGGWAGSTATLVTSSKFGGAASPGTQFAVGWPVDIWDASASPVFSVKSSAAHTVSSLTATTLVISGAPSFTPAVGDRITLRSYDNAAHATANAAGLTPLDYSFMADADGLLGSADADGDTWT